MSIIQDVLKKIREVPFHQDPQKPEMGKPAPYSEKKGGRVTNPMHISIAVLTVLVFLAILFSRMNAKTDLDYSALPPTNIYRPVAETDAAQARHKHAAKPASARFPGFVLTGIMQLTDGPRAIINNAIVAVGDVVGIGTVTKIEKDNVVLNVKDSDLRLEL